MADLKSLAPLRWIEVRDIPALFLGEPYPPRADRGPLGTLVRSLRSVGCITPILARPAGKRLQVICGYRRLLAAQAACLPSIPVLVRNLDDEACRRLFQEENSHREPLNYADAVDGYSESSREESEAVVPEIGAGPPDRLPLPAEETPLSELLELAIQREIVDRSTAQAIQGRAPEIDDQAAELRRIVREKRSAGLLPPAKEPRFPALPIGPVAVPPEKEPGIEAGAGSEALVAATRDPAGGGGRPAFPPGERAREQEGEAEEASFAAVDGDLRLGTLRQRLGEVFRQIRETRKIPVAALEEIAVALIEQAPVRRGRDLRAVDLEAPLEWIASHSLLVTGLGIHLAQSLEWTAGQVKKFALACLLHDSGMLFVPADCILSLQPLTPAQRTLVQKHPEMGRELILAARAWGAQLHLVAQDHHERWDGTGYPGRKKGKEVDLPARIVGFLSCLAALVSPRPHRPPLLYGQALQVLSRATEEGQHDPAVLHHFRRIFNDLPAGSCLRLGDGRIGRVIGFDPRNPQRYRVRIYADGVRVREEEPIWIEPSAQGATEIHPLRLATTLSS